MAYFWGEEEAERIFDSAPPLGSRKKAVPKRTLTCLTHSKEQQEKFIPVLLSLYKEWPCPLITIIQKNMANNLCSCNKKKIPVLNIPRDLFEDNICKTYTFFQNVFNLIEPETPTGRLMELKDAICEMMEDCEAHKEVTRYICLQNIKYIFLAAVYTKDSLDGNNVSSYCFDSAIDSLPTDEDTQSDTDRKAAMAKAKKRGLADKVRSNKKNTSVKVNPFEVKFNKQKHNVLGRKISKHDKGMPGLSRSKAIKKRKETLLVEYKKRGKVNKFLDKRIGENDPELPVEEKMLKRFAVERQRTHEKAELFKLNEEEDLTHYGQSLSEIEKFEDNVASESDDEEDRGKIAAKMVAEEHFGGFLTKKSDETEQGPKKSWKERMEEIIAKSKKEKYERQHEREKQLEETEKLDKEWKDLRSAIAGSLKTVKEDTPVKKKVDDYDIMVRELQFEMKGKPSDRLKTEEEQAQYEAECLQKLEEDRAKRMEGITPEELAQTHKSADDLDDGFDLDRPGKSVRFEVKYKDGRLVGENDSENDDKGNNSEDKKDEQADDNVSDESEDGSEEEIEEGGTDSDDSEDRMSDLQSSEDEEEAKELEKTQTLSSKVKLGILKKKKVDISPEDMEKKKKIIEDAKKELPYTFPAPESYEELLSLLADHSEEEQLTIIERVRKCHHPSLAEGNKEKLQTLFAFLVQYYCDMAVQNPPQLKFMDKLVKHLYELTQQSPMAAGKAIQEAVKDQEDIFCKYCEMRNGRGIFPTLDTLLLLKLVSVLFPTSDFWHPVVTPASLFLSQIITRCPINTTRDVASGLFVCTLFTEFVSFSKRFVPEVINFLHGILFLAIEKDLKQIEPVIHPFKPVGKSIGLLKLEKARDIKIEPLKLCQLFSMTGRKQLDSDVFKVEAIGHSLAMLTYLAKLYSNLPSVSEVYRPIKCMCEKLPIDRYPSEVEELQQELLEQCDILLEKSKKQGPLVMPRQIPQPLKQFEPKVEDSFDGKKKRGGTRDFNEKQRELHKYKKELAGARKEIVKDMKFVHDQKLKEQLDRDDTRKRKVKQIFHDLANQEGDYKALKRKKDNMK